VYILKNIPCKHNRIGRTKHSQPATNKNASAPKMLYKIKKKDSEIKLSNRQSALELSL